MDKPIEGFTLIETMVVLMLMGIILGLGMPSFLNLIEKMSAESEAKVLIEGMRTARLVAIEEKQRIVVCSTTDSTSCGSGSTAWDSGFIVFRDSDNTTNPSSPDDILFSHRFRDSVTVKIPSADPANPPNRKFYYNENGWTPGSASSVLVCSRENDNTNGFRVVVNRAGRIRVEDSTVIWRNSSGNELKC